MPCIEKPTPRPYISLQPLTSHLICQSVTLQCISRIQCALRPLRDAIDVNISTEARLFCGNLQIGAGISKTPLLTFGLLV